MLRFSYRQIELVFQARSDLGEVVEMQAGIASGAIVSGHPDHTKALFTANPEHLPTLTSESPLSPIVGPASVLTANGERHLRQRRLLLPSFHGEAIERYTQLIADVTEREIDSWAMNEPFALAPRIRRSPRGDHVRHLRPRRPPARREPRGQVAFGDQTPHGRVHLVARDRRRASQHSISRPSVPSQSTPSIAT